MNLGITELKASHRNTGLDDESASSSRGSVFLDIGEVFFLTSPFIERPSRIVGLRRARDSTGPHFRVSETCSVCNGRFEGGVPSSWRRKNGGLTTRPRHEGIKDEPLRCRVEPHQPVFLLNFRTCSVIARCMPIRQLKWHRYSPGESWLKNDLLARARLTQDMTL
jgi:hypothetical protein